MFLWFFFLLVLFCVFSRLSFYPPSVSVYPCIRLYLFFLLLFFFFNRGVLFCLFVFFNFFYYFFLFSSLRPREDPRLSLFFLSFLFLFLFFSCPLQKGDPRPFYVLEMIRYHLTSVCNARKKMLLSLHNSSP